ncbi:PREDICTED: uncharacterized protein LOC107066585 [Polistes dominula]|uniref:Uncharacterized protein LOC107066585 n=1 Tax=Polistes dominula TaxID=743375 RepID=A0ABM1I9E5_POLDO|nr:PREDICTED: uncharacterized protein LOC107066585 [Polistes dominula]XP_015176833.1 PREDICTED: uncharacterized protein LOC107066585 [Polistes dominula]
MISLEALVKIASFTGFAVAGAGYAFRYKIQNELREGKLYKDAMEHLNNHQKALDLLGTPIKEKRINISDPEKNGSTDNTTWLTIPIVGSKNFGELRVEALITEDSEKKLKADIYKIELKIREMPDKVFVMKDDSSTIIDKL